MSTTGHESTDSNPSTGAEIIQGARLSVAVGFGLFPLGMAFGLLVTQSGLAAWVAPALSLTGYAGSLEFLMIEMLVNTTALLTVGLTTLFVNFRHVFYAFSFPLHVVKNPVAKIYAMYAMTDEAYAITVAHPTGWTGPRLIALEVCLQVYWVVGGLTGALLGALLPGQIAGLDFALCALFITLTLDAVRSMAQVPSLLLAGTSFAVAMLITPDQMLFTALITFMMLLIIRYLVAKTRRGDRFVSQ